MRNILAILLILGAIGIYYGYTKNVFADISGIKLQLVEYKDTLRKANQLAEEQQALTDVMNSFNLADREKLDKMIPDNADNVRLIINIQNIAETTGLSIKDIKVNDENKQGTEAVITPADGIADSEGLTNLKYNFVTLSFTVVSTYPNFVLYLEKLEKSLRLVDITALSVKAAEAPGLYNFEVTLRSYWLK